MTATYLLRFDDICPTMDWAAWRYIEAALLAENVKPILAVVPDNRDEDLRFGDPHPGFWDEIRRWQRLGWTIGLHGYQHLYQTSDPGIVGLHRRSEFAGLSLAEQEAKIEAAVEIFRREGVRPDVWIAPAHSFDATTITVLKKMRIHRINDGFFIYPCVDSDGMMWVPQQMWRFRWMPLGVWTVCFHHNGWRRGNVDDFRETLGRYRDVIASFEHVASLHADRQRRWSDYQVARLLRGLVRVKNGLRQ